MHKTYRYMPRSAAARRSAPLPLAIKGLALIFFLCVVIRVFSALGADTASKNLMSGFVSGGGIVDGILSFELGAPVQAEKNVSFLTRILGTTISSEETPAAVSEDVTVSEPSLSAEKPVPYLTAADNYSLFYTHWATLQNNNDNKPAVITKPAENTNAAFIAVNNKTDYAVDTAALFKEPLKITLSEDSPAVLIIHTHGSEAFIPDGEDQYVESDPFRTQDMTQTVVRVGDELAAALEQKGISVIHDKGIYDYPSYRNSYSNSYKAIQRMLKKYPSIKLVIDIHRDHIPGSDGSVYKTIADIGNTACSQVKFVMGTDFSGLDHPNWKENLKLALHIQQEMNTLYPSLAKPIELSEYRYNQQATTGSMIVEVGCTGNTLQESLTAVRYFADALSNVVSGLYK